LGLEIAVFNREREYSRFRGSKREQEKQEGARESKREHCGAVCRGVAGGSLKWVPNLRLELPSIFSMP